MQIYVTINRINYLAILVGLKDGTIEFVNRLHKKITFSKPFHAGSCVVSLNGKEDYLISTGTDEQVIVYNTKSTIIERELSLDKENFSAISGAIKMSGAEKELIVTDELFGLTWISYDIEKANKDWPDISYKPVVKLFDHISDKPNVFATSNNKGEVRVWERVQVENGDEVSVEFEELWKLKGHKGTVNDMAYFKDGSFVTCGVDGVYRIWTSRKDVIGVRKVEKGSGGCCGSKCIVQ